MTQSTIIILGIESSCDDTAAAVIVDGKLLANCIANQKIHESYGGVVPELASRAHQQNIIPVVDEALKKANVKKTDLAAVAYTRGPGLIGSLLVGASFAKGFSLGLNIPLIEVNHMQAHILAHFIDDEKNNFSKPEFPFLCLTVSGGHTQIVLVKNYFEMEIIGQTMDDAAGEAFDKIAKIIGFPYLGGVFIDKLAQEGNPLAFKFPVPLVPDLNFSFSGLKTAFLYFIQKQTKLNPNFIEEHKADICASIQASIVNILTEKLKKAAEQTGISQIAIAGGVAANSGLRNKLHEISVQKNWKIFIPQQAYCTDNAAMIAITGYLKFLKKDFSEQNVAPTARYDW
ncbi:MAG: tRNA (adenosine(37)-N6)-threonylcarbamoyltransferase complex transferase subunit TsaD [Bacteroidia bacterium]